MRRTVFEFMNYRSYLSEALPTQGPERGSRAKLAIQLGVQKGFVSSVLHGNGDFSLEQALRISAFLTHGKDEREYFLLLVQKERAGSKDLADYFEGKLREIQARRREIRERVSTKAGLTEPDQLIYYSSWHYTAVHMCLRVEETQTVTAITRALGLAVKTVTQVLDFFLKTGLAEQQGERYVAGPTRIHLPSDSVFIARHHTNWRMQAIRSLDHQRESDLHYSSVMSISKEAAEKIRAILLDSIQASEPTIRDAKDESIYVWTMDLFELKEAGAGS